MYCKIEDLLFFSKIVPKDVDVKKIHFYWFYYLKYSYIESHTRTRTNNDLLYFLKYYKYYCIHSVMNMYKLFNKIYRNLLYKKFKLDTATVSFGQIKA